MMYTTVDAVIESKKRNYRLILWFVAAFLFLLSLVASIWLAVFHVIEIWYIFGWLLLLVATSSGLSSELPKKHPSQE